MPEALLSSQNRRLPEPVDRGVRPKTLSIHGININFQFSIAATENRLAI